MSGLSQYLALALFNATLNPSPTALTPPSGLWVGLHTAKPDDTTYGNEAGYSGYARIRVDSFTASVQAAGGESTVVVTNNHAVVFGPSTDGVDHYISHWAVWDAEAVGSGNILYSGSIVPSRVVSPGDWVVIPESNATITLD
jgi:hypothetical protein